jgi:hypothetical protein
VIKENNQRRPWLSISLSQLRPKLPNTLCFSKRNLRTYVPPLKQAAPEKPKDVETGNGKGKRKQVDEDFDEEFDNMLKKLKK